MKKEVIEKNAEIFELIKAIRILDAEEKKYILELIQETGNEPPNLKTKTEDT